MFRWLPKLLPRVGRLADRGRGTVRGTGRGLREPSRGEGGAATALFDVEPPAHPGAVIRGAPMSSNVRKFEEG